MRIKKVSKTTQTGAQIIDGYSNSQVSGYSCDYINKMDRYSTNEVKTNKVWIDGKPIYRKVYQISSMNANTEISINLSDLSYETIIDIKGFEKSNQFDYIPIVFYNVDYNWAFVEIKTLKFKVSWAASNVYLILEYTKTTDTSVI